MQSDATDLSASMTVTSTTTSSSPNTTTTTPPPLQPSPNMQAHSSSSSSPSSPKSPRVHPSPPPPPVDDPSATPVSPPRNLHVSTHPLTFPPPNDSSVDGVPASLSNCGVSPPRCSAFKPFSSYSSPSSSSASPSPPPPPPLPPIDAPSSADNPTPPTPPMTSCNGRSSTPITQSQPSSRRRPSDTASTTTTSEADRGHEETPERREYPKLILERLKIKSIVERVERMGRKKKKEKLLKKLYKIRNSEVKQKRSQTKSNKIIQEFDMAKTHNRLSLELPRCNWLEKKIKNMGAKALTSGKPEVDQIKCKTDEAEMETSEQLDDDEIKMIIDEDGCPDDDVRDEPDTQISSTQQGLEKSGDSSPPIGTLRPLPSINEVARALLPKHYCKSSSEDEKEVEKVKEVATTTIRNSKSETDPKKDKKSNISDRSHHDSQEKQLIEKKKQLLMDIAQIRQKKQEEMTHLILIRQAKDNVMAELKKIKAEVDGLKPEQRSRLGNHTQKPAAVFKILPGPSELKVQTAVWRLNSAMEQREAGKTTDTSGKPTTDTAGNGSSLPSWDGSSLGGNSSALGGSHTSFTSRIGSNPCGNNAILGENASHPNTETADIGLLTRYRKPDKLAPTITSSLAVLEKVEDDRVEIIASRKEREKEERERELETIKDKRNKQKEIVEERNEIESKQERQKEWEEARKWEEQKEQRKKWEELKRKEWEEKHEQFRKREESNGNIKELAGLPESRTEFKEKEDPQKDWEQDQIRKWEEQKRKWEEVQQQRKDFEEKQDEKRHEEEKKRKTDMIEDMERKSKIDKREELDRKTKIEHMEELERKREQEQLKQRTGDLVSAVKPKLVGELALAAKPKLVRIEAPTSIYSRPNHVAELSAPGLPILQQQLQREREFKILNQLPHQQLSPTSQQQMQHQQHQLALQQHHQLRMKELRIEEWRQQQLQYHRLGLLHRPTPIQATPQPAHASSSLTSFSTVLGDSGFSQPLKLTNFLESASTRSWEEAADREKGRERFLELERMTEAGLKVWEKMNEKKRVDRLRDLKVTESGERRNDDQLSDIAETAEQAEAKNVSGPREARNEPGGGGGCSSIGEDGGIRERPEWQRSPAGVPFRVSHPQSLPPPPDLDQWRRKEGAINYPRDLLSAQEHGQILRRDFPSLPPSLSERYLPEYPIAHKFVSPPYYHSQIPPGVHLPSKEVEYYVARERSGPVHVPPAANHPAASPTARHPAASPTSRQQPAAPVTRHPGPAPPPRQLTPLQPQQLPSSVPLPLDRSAVYHPRNVDRSSGRGGDGGGGGGLLLVPHDRLVLEERSAREWMVTEARKLPLTREVDMQNIAEENRTDLEVSSDGSRQISNRSFPQPSERCDNCGREASFMCSACKKVHYCSFSCQKDRWPSHSRVCT